MLCERCQERPAKVRLIKMVGKEKTEYHFCEQCAKEKGDFMNQAFVNTFDFNQLLAGLLNMESSPGFAPAPVLTLKCDTCGMTYGQFTQAGRFGCPDCYDNFQVRLEPLLRRIQTGNLHTGKVPVKSGAKMQRRKTLDHLRRELQNSIMAEQFERAAELRDEIRKVEQEANE